MQDDLIAFLDTSVTPFHAVADLARRLESAGYATLNEGDPWALEAGGRYQVVRNQGSIIAWRMPKAPARGLRMVGAHTDSPCLKLKPAPVLSGHGVQRLGVEVYGGVLLNPWFDRDLSIAGRVHLRTADASLTSRLVNLARPVAILPSLAIHLDREANAKRSINAQTDLPLLVSLAGDEDLDLEARVLEALVAEDASLAGATLLDHELYCHDVNGAGRVGFDGEFIASARLDNLLSCWCGVRALLDSDEDVGALLVCNDHEEVGSASSSGAAGPFLRSVLERIAPGPEAFAHLVADSMLISADNAHAVHPNFPDRHDGNHGPRLGGGPVIKVNANQRYASNSATQALFRALCSDADVPVQTFVTRTDLACGSTIGPITASEIGVRTLDVGVPQLAMHSIRELCHGEDPERLVKVLAAFQSLPTLPDLD